MAVYGVSKACLRQKFTEIAFLLENRGKFCLKIAEFRPFVNQKLIIQSARGVSSCSSYKKLKPKGISIKSDTLPKGNLYLNLQKELQGS